MVVRINEKAYEIVSKAEAKALLKQQIQATVDELKNELINELINELRNELRNELTCNTSWTNYQAQTQDQIEKYWEQTNSKYRYRGEHQPYKNGEYSFPTSLNIFYNGQLRGVLS